MIAGLLLAVLSAVAKNFVPFRSNSRYLISVVENEKLQESYSTVVGLWDSYIRASSMLAVSLSRCMKVPVRKYSAHVSIDPYWVLFLNA